MRRLLVASLVLAFALLPTACNDKSKSSQAAGSATSAGRKSMPREQFQNAVMGKSAQEVAAAVGEPDQKIPAGTKEEWMWVGLTINPANNKPDKATRAFFENGKVVNTSFTE